MKAIRHIKISKDMKVNDLVRQMELSGVMGAGSLAKAVDIFEAMIKDKDSKVFLGQAGAMVPGGMRQILIDMIDLRLIDVFVTTGATLTHDLVEALGFAHYIGSEHADDSKLHKQGFDRMYNSYMPNKAYEKLEDFIESIFNELSKAKTIREFLSILGRHSPKNSILNACYNNNVPIFCPAISDSGIGLMVWGQLVKNKNIDVNAFADLKEIIDIAWASKKNGVFYIGGGTPKNYIQQAMQFSKGASYGVQITTDRAEFGGSSGAPLKEGISWGKLDPKGRYVDVACDATIALPIIFASVKDRLK